MNQGHGSRPLDDPDDDALLDHTRLASSRSELPTEATAMVSRRSDPPAAAPARRRARATGPLDGPDDDALLDHTRLASSRSELPTEATAMVSRRPDPSAAAQTPRRPAVSTGPLGDRDDDALLDHTRMAPRQTGWPADATMASHQSGPPTDGTIVVARRSGPPTDGTIVVARRSGPPTDGTVVVRRSGPSTDGTIVVARRSGPPTDGTVVVRRGGQPAGTAMADPVLRGRPRPGTVSKPPPSVHEERPRYTPRAVPLPPGPPLPIMEGPTALRGTTPLPSVAVASRRGARVALAAWLVISLVCAAGVVWCATALFGG